MFEETEVVCRRMLKKILECFREDVIVEEFIQAFDLFLYESDDSILLCFLNLLKLCISLNL